MKGQSPKEKFAVLMLGLAEEGSGTLSEAGLTLKWNALKEHGIEAITLAVEYLVKYRKAKYPAIPTIPEINEAIELVTNPGNAFSKEDRARFQADGVWKFLKTFGSGAVPEFEDPVTQFLMTQSWPYNSWARTMTDKEHPFWKKEFIRAYTSHATTCDTFRRLNIEHDLFKLSRTATKRIPSLTHAHHQIPQVTE